MYLFFFIFRSNDSLKEFFQHRLLTNIVPLSRRVLQQSLSDVSESSDSARKKLINRPFFKLKQQSSLAQLVKLLSCTVVLIRALSKEISVFKFLNFCSGHGVNSYTCIMLCIIHRFAMRVDCENRKLSAIFHYRVF